MTDEQITIQDNENPQEEIKTEEQQIDEETVSEKNSEENTEKNDYEKLKSDFDTLNNQYIRLAADFDNYRKRQLQERESLLKYGMQESMKKLIEVLDNFERASKSIDAIDNVDKMKETFAVLNKQIIDSLTKLGLEEIKCVGETFNPEFHEAVMQTPTSEYPEETIIKELQKGYKLGDKVIRPAFVDVAVAEA